jgi:phage repressor protein C with HTH and peptisase S24 domain
MVKTKKSNNLGNNNDKNLIISRIKLAYNLKTDTELARFLGVSPNTITNWKDRNSINYDLIFTNCVKLNYDWLLTGRGEMLRNTNQNVQNSAHAHIGDNSQARINQRKDTENGTHKPKGIPLIPVSAMAGYGSGDVQVMNYDIQEDYLITPELDNKGVQYLIRAFGSSMIPKYNSGDLLACRPVSDTSFIQWGKVYVLDTDQGPLVKRLYPCTPADDDSVECRSDNFERYPPFKISKSSIRRIAIVVGVLRME